ncbi:MAG: hypothetical protein ACRC5T_10850, partial [Cetobacterium sp.]
FIDNKFLDLDFNKSKFVLTNKTISKIVKYDSTSTLFKSDGILLEGVNFFSMSLGSGQNFTFSEEVYYLDYSYNYKERGAVYSNPVLKDIEGKELPYDGYIVNKVSDGIFIFKMMIRGIEGIKPLFLDFVDELENQITIPFIIENNVNKVEYSISKVSQHYNYVETEEEYQLYTNKNILSSKIFITGENYKQINGDSYISVFDGRLDKRFKIFEDGGARCSVLELIPENIYTISYGESKFEKKMVVEKTDEIILSCDNEVITGLKEYTFKIETEQYIKLDFEMSGNFSFDKINDKEILIKKEAYSDFFEEGLLTIKASDENSILKPIIKTVSCSFYSDDVIREISINGKKDGIIEIYEDKFDLDVEVSNLEDIKEIYFHDSNEYSIENKVKPLFEGKIEGIITPYKADELGLYITFKNDVTIKKMFNFSVVKFNVEKIFNIEAMLKDEVIIFDIKNISNKVNKNRVKITIGKEETIFELNVNSGKIEQLKIPYNGEKKYEINYESGGVWRFAEKGTIVEDEVSKKFKFIDRTGFYVKRKVIINSNTDKFFKIFTNVNFKNIEIVFENQKKEKTAYKIEDGIFDLSNIPLGIYRVDVNMKTKFKEEIIKSYIFQIVNNIDQFIEVDSLKF